MYSLKSNESIKIGTKSTVNAMSAYCENSSRRCAELAGHPPLIEDLVKLDCGSGSNLQSDIIVSIADNFQTQPGPAWFTSRPQGDVERAIAFI